MRELPILFSGEMVIAILADLKHMTRRVGGASYEVGDVLWVRETHWISEDGQHIIYRADVAPASQYTRKWRPSIFMPKWARRIILEVTAVRREPLQAITEEDARAEGFDEWIPAKCITGLKGVRISGAKREGTCREHFSLRWDKINGKRCLWSSNPEVQVVTFKRL